jgi:hypothetical protein
MSLLPVRVTSPIVARWDGVAAQRVFLALITLRRR